MAKLQGAFTVRWQASDGKGVSIVGKSVKYGSSASGTQKPDSWQTEVPSITAGWFLWTWTHIEYSDGNTTDAYSVSRQGIDGKGIQSSTTEYKQMQDTSTPPESITDWGSFPTSLQDGWWLYTRQTVVYSDGNSAVSYSVTQIGQGSYYAGLSEYYCASNDPKDPPSGFPTKNGMYEDDYPLIFTDKESIGVSDPWKAKRSAVALKAETPYLWNFEVSYDSKGNKYVTYPSVVGNFAKGIISIVEAYAISEHSKPDESGKLYPNDIYDDDWTDKSLDAAPTDEKPYQWNKTTVKYNNGDTDVHYHVSAIKNKGVAYVLLENEMDSLLYDDAYTLIGGSVSTIARFFYDGVDLSDKFDINSSTGNRCYIEPSPSIGDKYKLEKKDNKIIVTVNGISDSTGYVNVNFVYNDSTYTKKFTVKRIVGGAKYQLECTPNVISYNKTTGFPSSTQVVINVKKIGSQGVYQRLSTLSGTGLYIRKNGTEPGEEIDHLPYTESLTQQPSDADKIALTVELLQGPVGSGVVIDAQEIPWAKTENGAQGNGIKSETHYCMFTMTFDQPSANDSGWVQLTDENKSTFDSNKVTKHNRYLWLKKVYKYDNGEVRALVSLLSQYVDGIEANLLRDTAFSSDGDLLAWNAANGYIAYEVFGHNNAFVRVVDKDYEEEEDGDTILQQYVRGEDSNIIIKRDTWYTLSFYARNDAFFKLDEDSSLLTTHTFTMPLKAGKKVTITYDIYNKSGYSLAFTYQAVDHEGSPTISYLDGLSAISFTPNHTGSYTLRLGLVNSSGNWVNVTSNAPYITYFAIDRGKGIDVQIPFLNGSKPLYHNGTVNGTFISWDLTTEWQHFYVTFKSQAGSIGSESAYIKYLLSKASNTTYICMPKLEENTAATAWIENHLDRVSEQGTHMLAGDWKAGTTYYYLQGVRQVVRYFSGEGEPEKRYYRLRKKTSPTGYVSNDPPYDDPEHWEVANHMPFMSSDIVLTEELMSKIIQVVQLKAEEIVTRSLIAMRDVKTVGDDTIQQKIASINEDQYPAGAIVQYWQASENDEEHIYNPQIKMVISDGVIKYYDQNGILQWSLGGSGAIEKPTQTYETVSLVYVCANGDNPSDTSSIRTNTKLKGTEYRKYVSISNGVVYKDTNDNPLNGWYTIPCAALITQPGPNGIKPASKYYRQVFKLVDGVQTAQKNVYFDTNETVII